MKQFMQFCGRGGGGERTIEHTLPNHFWRKWAWSGRRMSSKGNVLPALLQKLIGEFFKILRREIWRGILRDFFDAFPSGTPVVQSY